MKLLRTWLLIVLLSWLPASHAAQGYYTIPEDLTSSPFNCTYSAGLYTCQNLSLPHHTTFHVTEPVKIRVNGNFFADHHFTTTSNSEKLTLDVGGSVTISHQSHVAMELKEAGGSVRIGQQSTFTGDIWTNGALVIDQHTVVDGNVDVDGSMDVGKKSDITGTCRVGGGTTFKGCGAPPPASRFHHVRIEHSASGVTCMPSTLTIKACSGADTGGTCTPYTGGVSGTILASSAASQSLEFDIPDDSSETTVSLSSATAASFTLSSADTAYTCWDGGSTACMITFKQTGFAFSGIPDHRAGAQQTVTISAIETKADGKTCQPAFTSATAVTFRCAYANPSSGSNLTLAFVSSSATFACGGDRTMTVPFNSNGQATFALSYPDVGNITLTASAGANMRGQESFIAAPASFKLTATSNPIKAGEDTGFKVEAATTTGTVAASFGKESTPESAELSFKRCQPSTDTPSDGVFDYDPPAAGTTDRTAYTVKWTEVGNGDVSAKLKSGSYLGSGFTATGVLAPGTGNCGTGKGSLASVPHHFQTETGQPVYTYSGQPMKVIVSAHAKDHSLTTNYFKPASATSQTVSALTVGAWKDGAANPGEGSWNSTSVALDDITNETTRGKVAFTRTYTLGTKLTAPAKAKIRVNDANTTSSGFEEVETSIRNGRLRLSNVFGPIGMDLKIPVMAQYWSGSSWILNGDDNYTSVPLTAIALTRSGALAGAASPIPLLSKGEGKIVIGKPTSGTAGTVDLAVNLGNTGPDVSCLAVHPAGTTASKQSWLRHTYGSCPAPADPSARATFGTYAGQSKRTIYVREAFD